MARPKSNHPVTETAVKVTRQTKKLIEDEKRRWNSNEPYDRTIFRVFKAYEEYRKKVKAQGEEIIDLHDSVSDKDTSIERLLNIQKGQSVDTLILEDQTFFEYKPIILEELI